MRRRRFFYRRRYRFHQLTDEEMLLEILIPIIAVFVMLIVFLIIEYGKILLIFLIVLAIGLFAYYMTSLIVKRVRFIKTKNMYLSTDFYKDTETPFSNDILSRELNFEISVYNSIRETIGKRYYLMHRYSIPINEHSTSPKNIDLLLFHTTGIYVIETMNLSSSMISKLKPKEIEELKFEKATEYSLFNIHKIEKVRQYEKWIRSNTANSPIAQNQKIIDILKKMHNIEFENALVFSREMLMDEEHIPRTISSIYSEKEFMEHLKTAKTQYNDFQLYKIYLAFRDGVKTKKH
ncbi:MAG: NERD domain-containing protein [Firmicutes bacterium]|nr:NERD domain-containing protein [Bacillota bacterium]